MSHGRDHSPTAGRLRVSLVMVHLSRGRGFPQVYPPGARDVLSPRRPECSVICPLTVNETKTRLCRVPGGDVRLSGLYDRPVLADPPETGTVLYRDYARRRRRSGAFGTGDPRNLPTRALVGDGSRGPSGATEPAAAGVGRTQLPPRPCEPWRTVPSTGTVAIGFASGSCAKHKVKTRGTSRFPDQYLYDELGLIRLMNAAKSFPWAKA